MEVRKKGRSSGLSGAAKDGGSSRPSESGRAGNAAMGLLEGVIVYSVTAFINAAYD